MAKIIDTNLSMSKSGVIKDHQSRIAEVNKQLKDKEPESPLSINANCKEWSCKKLGILS